MSPACPEASSGESSAAPQQAGLTEQAGLTGTYKGLGVPTRYLNSALTPEFAGR